MMHLRAPATILGHARPANCAEESSPMPMATETKYWTLEEVHSLPDDGNKYELARGDLFVTPAPTNEHETVISALHSLLEP